MKTKVTFNIGSEEMVYAVARWDNRPLKNGPYPSKKQIMDAVAEMLRNYGRNWQESICENDLDKVGWAIDSVKQYWDFDETKVNRNLNKLSGMAFDLEDDE